MTETQVDPEIPASESLGTKEALQKTQVDAALVQLMEKKNLDPDEARKIYEKPFAHAMKEIERFRELLKNVADLRGMGAINEDQAQEIRPNGNGMSTYRAFNQSQMLIDLRPQILQMEKDGVISPELSHKLQDVYFVEKLKWREDKKFTRDHGMDIYLVKRQLDAIKFIIQTREQLKKEGRWTEEDDIKYDFNKVNPLVAETNLIIGKLADSKY